MPGVVLDLGCGESPFRRFFSEAQKYIRVDRKVVDEEVIEGDLINIPLSDESVDAVLIFQALSDTPHLESCMKEMHRVLKTDGKLIVYESTCYPEHDLPFDYFRILPEGLKYIANKTGFEVIDCVRLGGLFTRCAMIWNTFVMGQLMSLPLGKPLARCGIAFANLIFYVLDHCALHPRLASDYLCYLRKSPKGPAPEESVT